MPESRREFVTRGAAAVLGAAVASQAAPDPSAPPPPPAGSPPAIGMASAVGPDVTPASFAAAEKLVRVVMTSAEREKAAGSWRQSMAATMERRTGPRKLAIEPTLFPATLWDPRIPGIPALPARGRFVRSVAYPGPLPARDDDIAFAPVAVQSRWIEARALTSERLTNIYFER